MNVRRPKLPQVLKRFSRSQSGAIILLVALLMPVLIGFIGLGVEVGLWYVTKRELQSVVDAAALSGAHRYKNNVAATNTEIKEFAYHAATQAGFNGPAAEFDAYLSPTHSQVTPTLNGDATLVEAVVDRDMDALFSAVIGHESTRINVYAIAGTREFTVSQEACLVGLANNPGSGNEDEICLDLGGGATLNMPGCGVHANCTGSPALDVGGSLDAEVECISAVGEIDIDGNPTIDQSCATPVANANPLDDPFDGLSAPSSTGTPVQDIDVPYDANGLPDGDPSASFVDADGDGRIEVYLKPGYYSDMGFSGTHNFSGPGGAVAVEYILEKGTYYSNGDVDISSQAVVQGEDDADSTPAPASGDPEPVTFIIWGSDADFTMNGTATINLRAPIADDPDTGADENNTDDTNCGTVDAATDCFPRLNPGGEGLLVWDAAADTITLPSMSQCNTVNGDASGSWAGLIYAPNDCVQINGNGSFFDTGECFGVYSEAIDIAGNPTIHSEGCGAANGNLGEVTATAVGLLE
ncbi:MAG: pilus assembly protein TadG-related protein [Magnetospiraceae bacterium]